MLKGSFTLLKYLSFIITRNMSQAVLLPPQKNFYRRQLPETCISFSSDPGKEIFKEVLLSGHLACYFKLAAQFRTQDEPAFCGLSTLVMILNALEIDPGQTWKGIWRWYHENMLECCTPLEIVQQKGINFYQFICVAACNNLNVLSTRVDDAADVNVFRDVVKFYTQQDELFLVASYSRKSIQQTGDGHFCTIGGYHPERDLVLLMDTARFKYPPHWIPLKLLFEAMKAIDQDTGKSRGYMVLSRRKERGQLVLFRVPEMLSLTAISLPADVRKFLDSWKKVLTGSVNMESKTSDVILIESVLDHLSTCCMVLEPIHFMISLLKPHIESSSAVTNIINELEAVKLFSIISSYISKTEPLAFFKLFNDSNAEEENDTIKLQLEHFLTFFLLAWPYSCEKHDTDDDNFAGEMVKYVNQVLTTKLHFLKDEVVVFRLQLNTIFDFNKYMNDNPQCCRKSCDKNVSANP